MRTLLTRLQSMRLALLFLCLTLLSGVTWGMPVVLYDATLLPENAGWSKNTGTGLPTTNGSVSVSLSPGGTFGGLLNASTVGGTIGYAWNYYWRETGAGSFVISVRVAVTESSHNFGDAGFMLGVIGNPEYAAHYPTARWNGIYIDPTKIGFMDDQGGSFSLDATAFHEYAISYKNDLISIFVDQPFASVVDGSATAVLTRQLFAEFRNDPNRDSQPVSDFFTPTNIGNQIIQSSFEGVISFGDHTNDSRPPINSTYMLDFILFEQLSLRGDRPLHFSIQAVPEPSTITLVCLGFIGLGAILRRKEPYLNHPQINSEIDMHVRE